ncbi:hypothetical protein M378DRAFT_19540 [Amanita muscaria Koide BX008]|uniref:Uncharacterized protein n=1 Tax=Amanita muscaria (strain Koide BX008) TaxID=946122 RepID=A0A0C2RU88_AMAMK|nr:hypothetical protein M378DRAFT_19540 [Amanita muscaria Koide BX008]
MPLGHQAHAQTNFVGSEVRTWDDEVPTAHIAIAVEGVCWSSPDYFPVVVMQGIFVSRRHPTLTGLEDLPACLPNDNLLASA